LYHRCLDRKNLRYSTKKEKIRKELEDRAKDAASGITYEPCIDVGVVNFDDTNKGTPVVTKNSNCMALSTTSKKRGRQSQSTPATPVQCKDCHKMTTMHKTMVSSKCKEHWRYLQ